MQIFFIYMTVFLYNAYLKHALNENSTFIEEGKTLFYEKFKINRCTLNGYTLIEILFLNKILHLM